ncbi:MAG: acyl-[acyl-carrier-protein]-phospholipid O-acyltransferase [Lentisphaeria bacterium]|jgi:acyl-[acyl-carrier-protein]-phospholipid O-acyltransferase/long-chain-fatty-acid--[acyl-carrier-protein] ligase
MPTLAQAWIDSAKGRGGDTALIDAQSGPLSAHRALAVAIAFAKKMQCLSPEQNIGVLMPSSAGGVLANMATLLSGKTIVNLNYTSNAVAFASAVEQADIHTIYSSKKFIQKLAERGIDFSETLSQVKVIYLEELKQTISPFTLISTLLCVKVLPAWMLKRLYTKQQSNTATAAILFSSGSEGSPKGVMLSHRNFMANLKQIADVLNMDDKDVVMASLPLFHAFGLTVTQFMPLIEGLPMVCHPDPTDVLGISKAIASNRVTFLCGTSTFLRLYCRNAKIHPLMLESLKHVVAGAERLQPRVREAFKLKFNKDILEGYGATETTPVASVNLPDALDTHYWKVQLGGRPGTVGMPLPGTSFKIVAPNTLEELATGDEGMILIGGAQVMQGYLNNSELSDQAIRHIGDARWYVTGDKGSLDEDGFLTIVDRYSRFAKLGGEMISLTAVEQLAGKALNALANHNTLEKLATGEEQEAQVMAVNIHDDKKGEKIVLLSEAPISLTDLKREMLHQGCNSLTIPAKVVTVEVLPKLGSGKADFASAKKLASDQPHD